MNASSKPELESHLLANAEVVAPASGLPELFAHLPVVTSPTPEPVIWVTVRPTRPVMASDVTGLVAPRVAGADVVPTRAKVGLVSAMGVRTGSACLAGRRHRGHHARAGDERSEQCPPHGSNKEDSLHLAPPDDSNDMARRPIASARREDVDICSHAAAPMMLTALERARAHEVALWKPEGHPCLPLAIGAPRPVVWPGPNAVASAGVGRLNVKLDPAESRKSLGLHGHPLARMNVVRAENIRRKSRRRERQGDDESDCEAEDPSRAPVPRQPFRVSQAHADQSPSGRGVDCDSMPCPPCFQTMCPNYRLNRALAQSSDRLDLPHPIR